MIADAGTDTRERIVLAAAQAFAERGYCGVNLADVVEGLGFTKGALYFYFSNKESLASEIVERHFAAWEEVIPAVLKGGGRQGEGDYLDALVEISHRVAETYRSTVIAQAGSRLSAERNLVKTDLPEPFVGWIEKISGLLRAGKRAGQIRNDVDTTAVAQMSVGFFYGAQLVSDHLTKRQDLHLQLDLFWSSVLPSLRV
jgi:AcrR family transcriptional regulator